MGRIKEFYHDEICAMANGEEIDLDEAYMEQKWNEHENAAIDASIGQMERDEEEVNHSGVPKHLHSKF